jgi:hypothetical protein
MKISELKEAIREMIVSELNEAEGKVSTNDPAKAEMLAKKGVNVELTEDEALNEMASLVQASKEARRQGKNQEAKALETTEEKTIEQFKTAGISPNPKTGGLTGFASQYKKNLKNDFNIDLQKLFNDLEEQAEKDGENFNASIAINSIEKTAANKLTGKEIGQRGRKADPNKPAKEPKEPGMRGRPKSANPAVKKKEEKIKTFSMGDKKYYAGSEDEEGPSDLDLRKLAKSGGKFEKGKAAQLRAQEKTKLVKAFLKDMRDAGVVDNANRVLDKDKYATEWSKAKIEIEDKVSKLK